MDGYSRIYEAMRKAGGEGAQAGRLRLEERVLVAGDLVLLLTDDDQTFYLID